MIFLNDWEKHIFSVDFKIKFKFVCVGGGGVLHVCENLGFKKLMVNHFYFT